MGSRSHRDSDSDDDDSNNTYTDDDMSEESVTTGLFISGFDELDHSIYDHSNGDKDGDGTTWIK